MSFGDRHLLWHYNEALSNVTIWLESHYTSARWLSRRDCTHLCIHFLAFTHKMHRLVNRNVLKRKHDITPLKGKRAAAAIYWGKTSFHFWVVQGREGRQEKMVLSAESGESVLGKKWPLVSRRCGLYNAHLCSPYLPLGRKLKCQTIGRSQSIWF